MPYFGISLLAISTNIQFSLLRRRIRAELKSFQRFTWLCSKAFLHVLTLQVFSKIQPFASVNFPWSKPSSNWLHNYKWVGQLLDGQAPAVGINQSALLVFIIFNAASLIHQKCDALASDGLFHSFAGQKIDGLVCLMRLVYVWSWTLLPEHFLCICVRVCVVRIVAQTSRQSIFCCGQYRRTHPLLSFTDCMSFVCSCIGGYRTCSLWRTEICTSPRLECNTWAASTVESSILPERWIASLRSWYKCQVSISHIFNL